MKRQNDWYTGIDYYADYREKQIEVNEKIISNTSDLCIHEQVEIIFVKDGAGVIEVNGISYQVKEGSFLCLYMHHFYRYTRITTPLSIVHIKFHIGNFMCMCWEKHQINANATLVYDTKPFIQLDDNNYQKLNSLVDNLVLEIKEQRFSSMNIITYQTLQLHAYFCRFAYEGVTKERQESSVEWQVIPKIILSTGKDISLFELASEVNLSEAHLNQRIKQACGLTFFQLSKFGKVINACALLHFPELSINYISDLLNFSSINAFYRVFNQYVHMSPKQYQKTCIADGGDGILNGYGSALLFLQYIHTNFMNDIDISSMSKEFYIKEYTARLIFDNVYKVSFNDLLEQTRITYACSFLSTTRKSITEISNICRFDSISTFQRAFIKHMNQNPKEYRKLTNPNI